METLKPLREFDSLQGGFTLIPALDLLDGQAVRLHKGAYDTAEQVAEDPVEVVKSFVRVGTRRIHIVDLSGARSGRSEHKDLIQEIVRTVDVDIQVGGGIRSEERLEELFGAGISQAIVGTAAMERPDELVRWAERWPGRIIVGLDARSDTVALDGWLRESSESLLDAARRVASIPIGGIVYTDIDRDGTGTGPNVSRTAELARTVFPVPVIASGGVGSSEHIRSIHAQRDHGVRGLIVGKAIYNGSVDLAQCLAEFDQSSE
jgi:phosphoribosylformimino-5-aminoimidazole carboxamide ribotide isomerase